MKVQSYLSFEGRCEEAIEFYKGAVGAEVTALLRNKEMPGDGEHGCSPGAEDKILHSSFRVGETELMATDGRCTGKANFEGIALALSVADDAEAQRRFAALADGGQVQMPLTPTFFTSSFGMVADRFGVTWMLTVAP
jgi:PhnB protein